MAQKLTETDFTLQLIQMGARVYVPSIGRFLQVDPIEGGTDNNYVYVVDAVNDFDLSGMIGYKRWFKDRWGNVKSGAKKADRGLGRWYAWQDKHPTATQFLSLGLSARGGGKGKGGKYGQAVPLRLIPQQVRAAKLGFDRYVPAGKMPFNSHGRPGFMNKKGQYLTPDVDGHKGGVWKLIEMQGGRPQRIGTYDNNFNRIGK